MSKGLVWSLHNDRSTVVAVLAGAIDEDANFDKLAAELKSSTDVRFDMAGIARINSCGVREWVNFMRGLPPRFGVALEKCPPVVVAQLNMISNFAGNAKVVSVKAPYLCESCGHEEEVLVELRDRTMPASVARACPKCGNPLAFDDVEESYFAFML